MEEMIPLLPPDVPTEVLDFGLHRVPQKLKIALQDAVDRAAEEAETVVLGYGLCAMAVTGLRANGCTLVVPRVDDCIAIFLGSREAYKEQAKQAPGTYYLTKGWIEVNDTILEEYERMVERYDEARAQRMMDLMLKHYRRLVYIDTGYDGQEKYRAYAQRAAAQFDLAYEEIRGSNDLVRGMIFGPWDEEMFVVKAPGETIVYEDFGTTTRTMPNQASALS
jgi:hypothetical protein